MHFLIPSLLFLAKKFLHPPLAEFARSLDIRLQQIGLVSHRVTWFLHTESSLVQGNFKEPFCILPNFDFNVSVIVISSNFAKVLVNSQISLCFY